MNHDRVKDAVREKSERISALFLERGLTYPPQRVFLRVFKKEKSIEVWASAGKRDPFVLIQSYEMAKLSGKLGPKAEEGDGQVPEGFYAIDRFNPQSHFCLSMRLNFPNRYDRIQGRTGGDIYIHGGGSSIGCIPITDDKIKELYVIIAQARGHGQRSIPVHIFPRRLDPDGWAYLAKEYGHETDLVQFWQNLRQGFDLFEAGHQVPSVGVSRGRGVVTYRFKPGQSIP